MEPGSGCPACGIGTLDVVLELPAVPIHSTTFYSASELAQAVPRGELKLAVCRSCALVWNLAFEPQLVEYTPDYENSQHFSPAFQSYVKELTTHLATTYDLEDRYVVEIGSGKGEFLTELVGAAGCRGIGYDPTFDGEVPETANGVVIERRDYGPEDAHHFDAALVIARHVLEHVDDPVSFLRSLLPAGVSATPVYIEVPNAGAVFGGQDMWDLIYQHVAYFSSPALDAVARRAGYSVNALYRAFDGRFLALEAISGRPTPPSPDPEFVRAACEDIDGFARRLHDRLDHWRGRLTRKSGRRVLWGAGAKGVTFLNLLDMQDPFDHVVDLNPRKVGRYVPGMGQRVEAPDVLRGATLSQVVIPNGAYRQEVRDELRRLGHHVNVDVA